MKGDNNLSEVTLSITTVDGPAMIGSGGGGIRLTVGERRVNEFANEADQEWTSWMPEFVGDFVAVDLGDVVDAMDRLQSGSVALNEEVVVRLSGSASAFVFEPVSDDLVRVAFRVAGAERGDTLLPAPESARGYLVSIDALRRAVADAGRTFVERATSHGLDERVATFEAKVSELED